MIETIFLNNYKQFESFTLTGLKRLNIISGQNNTGKTSVLEAVFMFHDRRSVDLTKKQFVWRGVNFSDLTPAVLWQPLFFNFDLNNAITIATNGDGCDEKVTYQHIDDLDVTAVQSAENGNSSISASKVFSSNSNNTESLCITYSYGDGEQGHSSVYIADDKLGLKTQGLRKVKEVVFVHACAQGGSLNDAKRLGEIDIASGLGEITNYLKIIEPRLTSLSIVPHAQQGLIYGDIGLKRKMPIAFMGEGITRLLSILVAIASTPDGIVCVDEIENGIHYSLFPKVWEAIETMAKAYNCQMFITTHSHDALHGLYEYSQQSKTTEISFTRLDRVEHSIVAKMYSSDMLSAAMDRQWELR